MKEQIKILKKHILTGTSHMIPFIVAGGILFSISVMLNPAGAATPDTGWLGRPHRRRAGLPVWQRSASAA